MGDDFDALETPAETVGGFTVSPITVERVPYLTRALRPLAPEIQLVAKIFEGDDAEAQTNAIVDLVADHGERLIDAVACAVAPDFKTMAEARAKVGKLDTATFIQLLVVAVKVNADFFVRQLLPMAKKVATELRPSGPGQTPANT